MTALSISTASATGMSGTDTAASTRSVLSSTDLGIVFESSGGAVEARFAVNGVEVPVAVLGSETRSTPSAESAGIYEALYIGRAPIPDGSEAALRVVASFGAGAAWADGLPRAPLGCCALEGMSDPFETCEIGVLLSPSALTDDWD